MRHSQKGRKFGRERNQRRALMKSLASSFFTLGKIRTTEAKAKELRAYAEKMVTRGKNATLANRRYLAAYFSPLVTQKVIDRGQEYKDRNGGYTRVIKLGARKSDSAKLALIEFVK